MRLPNGTGSVYKLSGKRRKPWVARITKGWEFMEEEKKVRQLYSFIGYYPTKQEALTALINYNQNPYDLDAENITFKEVYEKWSDIHFENIVPSAARTWKSAYSYCTPLLSMRMKDIRVSHLEFTIKQAAVGIPTKQRMKSLFNMLFRYSLKHELVDKNYAELCDPIKNGKPKIIRIPFSTEEINTLWENITFPFVDMLLIGIYSGWRPNELAILKINDIDLENKTFLGGLKTDAGRNRIVPIHSKIFDLVKENYDKAQSIHSDYLFNDFTGQKHHMTYDKYRRKFEKIMNYFGMSHRPHDTRHTFVTLAKFYNMNDFVVKLIVGHAIQDITEKVYTHRTIDDLKIEIEKIK